MDPPTPIRTSNKIMFGSWSNAPPAKLAEDKAKELEAALRDYQANRTPEKAEQLQKTQKELSVLTEVLKSLPNKQG